MILLAGLLFAAIFSALLVGQFRLTTNALRSGEAGWGRYAADRSTQSVGYYVWVAVYVVFLVYVGLMLLGTVVGISMGARG